MKFKETTWKEFNNRFTGLRMLAYERKDYKAEFGRIIPVTYRMTFVYNKKKDCTYIAIAPVGYIDIFGIQDDTKTFVVRKSGRVDADWYNDNNESKEELRPFFEELYRWYQEKLDKRREA